MRNRTAIYSILTLIIAVGLFLYQNYSQKNIQSITIDGFNYLPTSTTGQIIQHENYSLSYNELYEQAEWVAWELNKSHLTYDDRRRPYFINDPKVLTQSANYKNFKGSGYDRGHLCPAGDRRFSLDAYNETFYTSNITPQKNDFNAGIWNRLEMKTRQWAKKYNQLYIVTGGVLTKDLKTIGYEDVAVPNYFYKVILDYSSTKPKAIAFLFPHKESNKSLKNFVVSIDEIEQLTTIDFFPNLPDELENRLESSVTTNNWKF
ncbi:DNA/RNA non-specific endonuclease [Urechidicola croceus]|uniref:Endonuclease n=1 Tax=Urechidicola croceus TaxID=1850246 RepID=A0A1D8P7C1_9FLAO|nr:DNA/RNA non-specific endonuclease [Urechidicola croceus]AOW20464.1 endonuclease [Urechidicola croceus]